MTPTPQRPRLQLIPNVSEIGLLVPLARSRGRLIASALASTAALFAVTAFVASYIMEFSTSVGVNLLLITAAMLFIVVAAYIQAMLIGDLFFPGNFREDVLLNRLRELDPNSPEALDQTRYRSYNLAFLVAVLLLLLGNYVATRAAFGDWLEAYHQIGYNLTELRADDDDARKRAFTDLAKPLYKDLWTDPRLVETVRAQLKHPRPEARQLAAWGAGAMHMTPLYDDLLALLQSEDKDTAAAAAVALGKLGDPRAWPHLQALLERAWDRDPQLALAGLRGVAMSRAQDLGPIAMRYAALDQPELRDTAHFALMQIAYLPARGDLFERLESGSPEAQCAALESLKFIAAPEDIPRLKARFQSLDTDDPTCQERLWIEPNDHKNHIIWSETHRIKLLKAVWNAGHGAELEWFHTIAIDKEMPWPLRAQAADLVEIARHESQLRR